MNREAVIDCLCERVLIEENDPVLYRIWDRLTELLSENSEETIDFLNECTEEQLFYISEVFEDISFNLQSEQFIDTLYKLDRKYPELQMKSDIKIAEEFMGK